MNENIVFSPVEAEKLNKKVCETLAKHLFMFCNYNPDSITVFGDDAKFMQAILNMYKLLIDAGICNNLWGIGKKYSINYDHIKFEDIIKSINSIRTTLGHNVDERSGNEKDKEVAEQWLLKVVGKKKLTNAEEYKKAVEKIERYGEDSITILTNFVESAGGNVKKGEIVKEWENLIISFYKRSNSRNILEGQLMLAYQSRLGIARKFSKVDVAEWVQKMLFYREQLLITNLREIIQKSSLSPSQLEKIGEQIDENEKIINEKNDKVALFSKKRVDSLRMYDYWDYYVYMLPIRIEEKLADGVVQSLLPQDVVQQIIEEDFDGVPI